MAALRGESAMSQGFDQPMPRLGQAMCEQVEISVDYKSGATYRGPLCDNKKVGRGVFAWPNGARYDGEFVDNSRHGKGTQSWEDGSFYDGDFVEDVRHGEGVHTWANGERYTGTFFKDHRHGNGQYAWPDGSTFQGTFYMDSRSGYGHFRFGNGAIFQGLYSENEREGPGLMTHSNGSQDVGLWHREHLAKLCGLTDGAFTMSNHNEFDYNPTDHQMYITVDDVENRTDLVRNIINTPPPFDYVPSGNLALKSSALFSESLHSESLALDREVYDREFQRGSRATSAKSQASSVQKSKARTPITDGAVSAKGGRQNRSATSVHAADDSSSRKSSAKSSASSAVGDMLQSVVFTNTEDIGEEKERVVAWNKTPSSVLMQKHILRYQSSQHIAGFEVDAILRGDRKGFGGKGAQEESSEEFLKAAEDGDLRRVTDMLVTGQVYVDVADKNGHTALIGAAVNWHLDVINLLLDNGADVNKLNDEGISALAACHVFFYPVDNFKYNAAEQYLDRPPDAEKEHGYDVEEAIKGILAKSKKQQPEKRGPQLDTKKIQKYKQEYRSSHNPKPANNDDDADDEKENKLIDNKAMIDSGFQNGSFANEDPPGSRGKPDSARQVGTLQVRRSVRLNIDEVLALEPEKDSVLDGHHGDRYQECSSSRASDDDLYTESEMNDFESHATVNNYRIEVTDQLIERCATQLSTNQMVVGRQRSAQSSKVTMGTVRRLAVDKKEHELMESTIRQLLKRGADPNASTVPMPVLFFAVKAADVTAVRALLQKGASTNARLPDEKGGLGPLHIAAAIPGEEGVAITELLLDALADPDVRALEDDSFLNRSLEEEWKKDPIDTISRHLLGGRTPLHIACARDDNYKNACKVVHLLLDHHANPNLLCNGHSPLALCVASGNDLAIDELLVYGADPCLPLTHGVGSALCIASSTEYEHRRTPEGRIALIDKLVAAGGDMLAPILIGPKRMPGTAVDYAYYMYNLDRRIAHMPYHALTPAERETFNARRHLLGHVGDILRQKAVDREKKRLVEDERGGRHSRSPSPNFVYVGAGANLPPGIIRGKAGRGMTSDSHVSFGGQQGTEEIRRPLLRYCYECGRSVGVRLSPCTRCKEVHYCSKACKLKAWNARHKEECVRVGGRSSSPKGKDKRIDSPTPATDPDRGRGNTLKSIQDKSRIKLPPVDTNDYSGANGQTIQNGSSHRNMNNKKNNLRNNGKYGCQHRGNVTGGGQVGGGRGDGGGVSGKAYQKGSRGVVQDASQWDIDAKVSQRGKSMSAMARDLYGDRSVYLGNYSFV